MSNNCPANTLFISRPSRNSACDNGCDNNLGISDPVNKSELSPRRNRTKVKSQIRDYVLYKLGAPVVPIELDDQQLDCAVDFALQVFEDYAPREYFQYYVFNTIPGQSVYKLPPDVGMVRNVYYKKTGTFAFQASDLGGALPIEYAYGGASGGDYGGMMNTYQPMWGRMGEWVLYKQYEQMYSRTSSNLGGWEWLGGFEDIKIYPVPYRVHPVIVHYLQKQKDWRQVTQAMQEGALVHAKEILGRIRSRIKNPPGPNGGVQLDGDALLAEAFEGQKNWEERLLIRFGDVLGPTMD